MNSSIALFNEIKKSIDTVISERGLQGKLHTEYVPNDVEWEQSIDIYYASGIRFGHIDNSWRGEDDDIYWNHNKWVACWFPMGYKEKRTVDNVVPFFNEAIDGVKRESTCLDR